MGRIKEGGSGHMYIVFILALLSTNALKVGAAAAAAGKLFQMPKDSCSFTASRMSRTCVVTKVTNIYLLSVNGKKNQNNFLTFI